MTERRLYGCAMLLFWSVSSACHKDATHAKKDVLE